MVVAGILFNIKSNKMEAHYYNVYLNWTTGRKGEISSPELDKSIKVATPPQFPKVIEGVWSPEHLLIASLVSCYMTTFLSITENSKLKFDDFKCTTKGKLEIIDGKYCMTEIILEPTLIINNEANTARAERVLQKSETACLISNSIKSKVTMIPVIKISEVSY
jgi:peroxiredoxin-like protein